jgi:hypothetical protein
MTPRLKAYLWSAAAAMTIGLGVPTMLLVYACLWATSEGCMWIRGLFPGYVAAGLLLLGVPTFFLVKVVIGRYKSR